MLGCTEPIDAGFGSCELLVDRIARCGHVVGPEFGSNDPSRVKERLRQCRKYPLDFKGLLPCGLEPKCDLMSACLRSARGQQDTLRQRARLGGLTIDLRIALEGADWAEADVLCRVFERDLNLTPEVLNLCEMLPLRANRELFNAIEALRNVPQVGTIHIERCPTLLYWAERVSPAHRARAQQICEEAELALDVQATLEAARTALVSLDPRLPFACGRQMTVLDTLGTDWARVTSQVLGITCYSKLGAHIVESGRGCPPNVRRALEAFDARPEFGTEIADRLARVRVECER
ncbi:MAG: hypothetical protein ACI9OJ_000518 [Myxococcota bacterium]|jgi:hypothetical protein